MTAHSPLAPLAARPFYVMDGAGNDFVIVDLRSGGHMTAEAARHLGDRNGPFGCDQIITLEMAGGAPAMGIFNADGGTAGACGNAARCVAEILMREEDADTAAFGSPAGLLSAQRVGDLVAVDMGRPRCNWDEIPLASAADDTVSVAFDPDLLKAHGLDAPAAVSMGNPHVVFFVADAERAPLETFGPVVERHPAFPEGVNVSVVSEAGQALRLRTWERGVGITKACGTAACAALVSAVRRGLGRRESRMIADGGILVIRWDGRTDHVEMAGPTRLHRRGTIEA